ncbi:TRAP transporter small permease [Natrinema sp. 74]|uniref:TRAP transporter small permease n=1 Tax=Natrinema sp. 74 TaxID=3384159 RepID=UPI0038D461F8
MDIDQSLGLKKDTWYDRIVLNVATLLFILMLVLTTAQVIVRIFDLPISGGAWWTEPVARYSLMTGTYVGAAVASRNGEHIKMTIISNQLEERFPSIGTIVDIIAQILTILFLVLLTYAGLQATLGKWSTPMLGVQVVKQGWIYGTITASLGMMIIYELINLYSVLTTNDFSRQFMSTVTSANKEGE